MPDDLTVYQHPHITRPRRHQYEDRPETVEVVHRVEVTHRDGRGDIGCLMALYVATLLVLGSVIWVVVRVAVMAAG